MYVYVHIVGMFIVFVFILCVFIFTCFFGSIVVGFFCFVMFGNGSKPTSGSSCGNGKTSYCSPSKSLKLDVHCAPGF